MTRFTDTRARSCHQGAAQYSHAVFNRAAMLFSLVALAAALSIGCAGNPVTGPDPLPEQGAVIVEPVPEIEPLPDPQPVPPAVPDLVISKLNFSPGAPTTSDEITFWVFVKNIGSVNANPSTVRFKVGGETSPPESAVPALSPGQEYRYERKVTLDVAQTYQITATADARHDVVEEDESNNVRTRTFSVAQGAQPDLVVSLINFSPGAPSAGDEITFWVFVKNQGAASAPASSLRFRVGGESHPPVVGVPALAPGAEYRYTRKVTLNVPQKYQVTGTADAQGAVSESDESNNVTIRTFTVLP